MTEKWVIAVITTSSYKESSHIPVVLQVLPALNGGGVERGTLEIAGALRRVGWVSLVASEGGRLLPDLEKTGTIHFNLLLASKNPVVIYKNIAKLAKIIKENNVDIVHVRSRASAWSAYYAAKKSGVKLLTTVHGIYGFGPLGLKKVYNKVMLKGDLIITVSDFVANLIRKEYNVLAQKIRVIHRGVDTDFFNPERIKKEDVKALLEEWQVPEDKKVIMMPCRLSRWKGHHLMLEALSLMKNKGDFVCVFIGSLKAREGYKKELLDYANDLGLKNQVKIIGYTKDIATAYMAADIVVSAATRPEAFGRTIVEAQAMARIVVAADEGGACETVKNGLTGFLFESRNVDDLVDTLDRVSDLSRKEKEVLTETARNCAANDFSVNAMCTKTLKVYEELL